MSKIPDDNLTDDEKEELSNLEKVAELYKESMERYPNISFFRQEYEKIQQTIEEEKQQFARMRILHKIAGMGFLILFAIGMGIVVYNSL